MRIFYFPLEPLPERYTVQLSAPLKGWLESRWVMSDVPYKRVEGKKLTNEIKVGSVLDANGRGYWACSQIMEFLSMVDKGKVRDGDVLYFDDFWHPGFSALPYTFHLTGLNVKMYAMLHAQSVDPFDFTYPMRYWMRYFEQGIGSVLDGIFVTSTCLKDMVVHGKIAPPEKVHVVGLPYNSDEVKTHWPKVLPKKKKQVVFSSRWDKEKKPDFFIKVAEEVLKKRTDIKFVVTTSFKKVKSNDNDLIFLLRDALDKLKGNLELREGQTKEEYYFNLLESRIQFNCADQDFVSWTLLEATTCGCTPVYPYYLSFPEALEHRHEFMYHKDDINSAVELILKWIDYEPDIQEYEWVYTKYDRSWERMLAIMRGEDYETLYCG